MFNPMFLILPILGTLLYFVILFAIVQQGVILAMRRARREGWTEENDPENATWLSSRQREELAAHKARREGAA